ncbi:MAG: glycosyltransferase [Bacteroidota bacterium]|nr:glycosyltransferase [Bacteroidota bacterium]
MKKKVLFLSAWYPNRYDPMPGLFVKRHAETMSADFNVAVLYTHPVENFSQHYQIESSFKNGVFTTIVYYQKIKTKLPLFSLLLKFVRFFKAHILGFSSIKKHYGLPHFIHVNILTRVGVFALYLKIRHGIPYVITEHWSRYNPTRNAYKGIIRKIMTNVVVKHSSGISVVSRNLKEMMQRCHIHHPHFVITNNVVSDDFFNSPIIHSQPKPTVFIHISCFDNQAKNTVGIVRAVHKLSKQRNDFICMMVGDGPDRLAAEELASYLGINNNYIRFTGLKEGKELINIYNQSAFTILFSNYENMPVVIAESFACGKPVVSTDVGGIAEIVTTSTGILVPPGNEAEFVQAINYMLNHYTEYDAQAIRNFALKQFSAKAVARQISALYGYNATATP